ncbi:MAG TPA: hypothetical protein VKB59_16275 [Micromonosporaceae bacterium]|nr:hypothetical protein [Micromonosporaceae bacterium]
MTSVVVNAFSTSACDAPIAFATRVRRASKAQSAFAIGAASATGESSATRIT